MRKLAIRSAQTSIRSPFAHRVLFVNPYENLSFHSDAYDFLFLSVIVEFFCNLHNSFSFVVPFRRRRTLSIARVRVHRRSSVSFDFSTSLRSHRADELSLFPEIVRFRVNRPSSVRLRLDALDGAKLIERLPQGRRRSLRSSPRGADFRLSNDEFSIPPARRILTTSFFSFADLTCASASPGFELLLCAAFRDDRLPREIAIRRRQFVVFSKVPIASAKRRTLVD